jgi:hypothetical protein
LFHLEEGSPRGDAGEDEVAILVGGGSAELNTRSIAQYDNCPGDT